MKTIGFVSAMMGAPWGGSEELWSQAAKRLAAEGHTVAVSVQWWAKPAPQVERLRQAGCLIETRNQTPDARLHARLLRRLRRHDHECPQSRWLEKIRPDIVIISLGHQTGGLEWMKACAVLGVPYAIIVQAASEHHWPSDDHLLPVGQAYESAKACFFVSEGNRRLLERQFATPLRNASVVRNPYNVSYEAAPPWPEGEDYRLACVARLESAPKGQDILFEVLSQDKWRNRPISVSLVGEGGNRASLEALKHRLGLRSVFFRGFVSDIASVWADHHMLILPSRYEGLPLALVEAMLCGRAAIVTDVAGNAELIQDGGTGFVALAPTVGSLDEAMERAWQRRCEWQTLGQAAASRVRDLIPLDPVGDFVEDLKRLI